MICKIKVQVIYRSLEDSSPRVNIVRLKLQYARKFVLFGLEIQQIYVKIPEFSLKIKTPTIPYAFLKLILIFCTVPDSLFKFLSYILAFLKVIINSYSFHVCPKVSLLVSVSFYFDPS